MDDTENTAVVKPYNPLDGEMVSIYILKRQFSPMASHNRDAYENVRIWKNNIDSSIIWGGLLR